MPILQITFKLTVSSAEYRKICHSVAEVIADVPGLIWKVWLLNERDGEAGGIYLFDDDQSLAAYLSGPIIAHMNRIPQLREISAHRFGTIPELTIVTRDPIASMVTVIANKSLKWEGF